MVLQTCIVLNCVELISPLQSADFAQVFQPVLILWLPLVAAALILKVGVLSCVTGIDNIML